MVRWMRRTKKKSLPPGADARDRALFAKLRDYLIRMDDDVTCKTCGKRFDIPSHQSMVFVDESGNAPSGTTTLTTTTAEIAHNKGLP